MKTFLLTGLITFKNNNFDWCRRGVYFMTHVFVDSYKQGSQQICAAAYQISTN